MTLRRVWASLGIAWNRWNPLGILPGIRWESVGNPPESVGNPPGILPGIR